MNMMCTNIPMNKEIKIKRNKKFYMENQYMFQQN